MATTAEQSNFLSARWPTTPSISLPSTSVPQSPSLSNPAIKTFSHAPQSPSVSNAAIKSVPQSPSMNNSAIKSVVPQSPSLSNAAIKSVPQSPSTTSNAIKSVPQSLTMKPVDSTTETLSFAVPASKKSVPASPAPTATVTSTTATDKITNFSVPASPALKSAKSSVPASPMPTAVPASPARVAKKSVPPSPALACATILPKTPCIDSPAENNNAAQTSVSKAIELNAPETPVTNATEIIASKTAVTNVTEIIAPTEVIAPKTPVTNVTEIIASKTPCLPVPCSHDNDSMTQNETTKQLVVEDFDLDLDDKAPKSDGKESSNENDSESEDEEVKDEDDDSDLRDLTSSVGLNDSVDWLATESFESMDEETLKKSFENHDLDYDALVANPESLRAFLQNVRRDLESRGKTMQSIDLVERLEKVLEKKELEECAAEKHEPAEKCDCCSSNIGSEIVVQEQVQQPAIDSAIASQTTPIVAVSVVENAETCKTVDSVAETTTESSEATSSADAITNTVMNTQESAQCTTVVVKETAAQETEQTEQKTTECGAVNNVETVARNNVETAALESKCTKEPQCDDKSCENETKCQETETKETCSQIDSSTNNTPEIVTTCCECKKTAEESSSSSSSNISETATASHETMETATASHETMENNATSTSAAENLQSEPVTDSSPEASSSRSSSASSSVSSSASNSTENAAKTVFSDSAHKYAVVGIQDQKPDIFEIESPATTEIPAAFLEKVHCGFAIRMRRIKDFEKEEIRYSRKKAVVRQLFNIALEETERKEPFFLVAFNGDCKQFYILTRRMMEKHADGFPVATLHFATDLHDLETHLAFKQSQKTMPDGSSATVWQHCWLSDSRELCVHVEPQKE